MVVDIDSGVAFMADSMDVVSNSVGVRSSGCDLLYDNCNGSLLNIGFVVSLDGQIVVVVVAVAVAVFVVVLVMLGSDIIAVDGDNGLVVVVVVTKILLVVAVNRFSGTSLCFVVVVTVVTGFVVVVVDDDNDDDDADDNKRGSTTVVTRKRDLGLGKKLVGEQLVDEGGVIGEVVALHVARWCRSADAVVDPPLAETDDGNELAAAAAAADDASGTRETWKRLRDGLGMGDCDGDGIGLGKGERSRPPDFLPGSNR